MRGIVLADVSGRPKLERLAFGLFEYRGSARTPSGSAASNTRFTVASCRAERVYEFVSAPRTRGPRRVA